MGSSFASITNSRFLYVGTYTAPHTAPGAPKTATGKGIAVYLQSRSGHLELINEVETENPSSLATNSSSSVLYSVSEVGVDDQGAPLGLISAYSVNSATGDLTLLNRQSTNGSWPCHCSVHPSDKFVFAANYGSGEFVVFPVEADGALSKSSNTASGKGCGHDPARQTGPHAHMILTEPQSGRVYGVDLGLDRVFAWGLDETAGAISPVRQPFAQIASGSGPRHMAFSFDGNSAFVLNELSSTIDMFAVTRETGAFIWQQTVSLLPEDSRLSRPVFDPDNPGLVPEGTNTGSEIRLHPNGRWLYATNRGMNTIVQFEIDATDRRLTPMAWSSSKGECPRGMGLSPDGSVLIVGNQNSNNIVVFPVDKETGKLGGLIQSITAPTPVDFAFGAEIV